MSRITEATDKYIESHPELKDERENLIDFFSQFYKPDRYIGIDCGAGWWKILNNGHQALKMIHPDYTIVQVKEKFGNLRFYVDSYPKSDTPQGFAVTAIIRYMENLSSKTCEKCGEDSYGYVELANSFGWMHTFCVVCELEYIESTVAQNTMLKIYDFSEKIENLKEKVEALKEFKITMAKILESN